MPTMPTTVPMSGCGNIGQKWKGKGRAERGDPRKRIRKWKQRYSRKIIHLLCFLFPNCQLSIVHFQFYYVIPAKAGNPSLLR
ncbi:hypothetical protein KAU32_10930 [bacterium]|nr:hypothetical protein [bacterium]